MDHSNLYYLDEAGMKGNEVVEMGWSPKGSRCYATRSGQSSKRLSFISAIASTAKSEFITPMIFEGCCTRRVFEEWLCSFGQYIQEQKRAKDTILILDNATFHKGGEIENIAREYNLHLVYLPPYSPELNPIEKCWAVLKSKVRVLLTQGKELYEALVSVFKSM